MAAPIDVRILENEKQVAENVCSTLLERAEAALAERQMFTIGLSGGSMAKFVCQELVNADVDFSAWHFFFCDERHVAFDHSESTYKYYKENLFDKAGIADSHVYKINPNVSVDQAALDYRSQLRAAFTEDVPRFDILLLGMGPDGHTCSLFPGHPLVQKSDELICAISDSPKPPPSRVTMTFPLINNCRLALFAATGEGKADIVKRVLEDSSVDPLPAAMVRPTNGTVTWFLDKMAASKLTKG